jgi:hypothetical protein
MKSNLRALVLVLLAVSVFGAVAAQGASATEKSHEFHSDGEWTVATGANTEPHEFKVGSAGTVKCEKAEFENESVGTFVSSSTYKADTLTVTGRWSECTFGGQPATVNTNHCAFVVDSDTTTGNPDGGEDANVEIECAEGNKIEVDTAICTFTVGPQTVKHMIRVENDTATSISGGLTAGAAGGASAIVFGKVKTTENQTGCALAPSGALGSLLGRSTSNCYKDEAEKWLSGTAKTTPQGVLKEGAATNCSLQ